MDEEKKKQLGELLQIEQKWQRIGEIEQMMKSPAFWANQDEAQNISREYAYLQKELEEFEGANSDDALAHLELKTLLNGKYDHDNALVSIHAGAGGTESQDWVSMLVRMYQRFCESKGGKWSEIDSSRGEEVGYKSITMRLELPDAYGWLRSENGVHRLVRISPFDADKARHTSFALVEVLPELAQQEDIEINDKDLRIDVFHAGGHGGQSVNTTDSAVRITHNPSGIVVVCQNERSQLQNKLVAMSVLKSRLLALRAKEDARLAQELKGGVISAEWGNQIRSYVLQPYQMVKDHRTDTQVNDAHKVLEGNLDPFLEAYLRQQVSK